jgi:hypothetical protein
MTGPTDPQAPAAGRTTRPRAMSRPTATTPAATTGTATSQPLNVSPIASAVAAATALLATLSDAQRAAVSFALDDAAQRARWSNFPNVAFPRAGLRMGDLSQPQRDAVMAVLEATLSSRGYQQVLATVAADEVLEATEPIFGQDEYWFALLGTPSAGSPWRWQFGGHHLGLNATFGKGDVTLAPSLTGAQPASYTQNGARVRPLGAENDAAFALINLLDASQRQQAVIGSEPIDLARGPGKDGVVLQPEGIVAAALSAEQQKALLALISTRVGIVNDTAAAKRMAEIQADLAQPYLAWSGPTTSASAAYWRVQGPTLVIEYAPQWLRSGQPTTNHIHAMYRDPTNDYGAKLVE